MVKIGAKIPLVDVFSLPLFSTLPIKVACMQFINIVVHSVENMNFRVFLQYEFTQLGLDEYLEVRRIDVLFGTG